MYEPLSIWINTPVRRLILDMPKFGLIRIDDSTGAQLPKQGYNWYRDLIAQNGVAG